MPNKVCKNFKTSDLTSQDHKHILERFVENDEALGQLLDFISSHSQQPGENDAPASARFDQVASSSHISSKNSGIKLNSQFAVVQPVT